MAGGITDLTGRAVGVRGAGGAGVRRGAVGRRRGAVGVGRAAPRDGGVRTGVGRAGVRRTRIAVVALRTRVAAPGNRGVGAGAVRTGVGRTDVAVHAVGRLGAGGHAHEVAAQPRRAVRVREAGHALVGGQVAARQEGVEALRVGRALDRGGVDAAVDDAGVRGERVLVGALGVRQAGHAHVGGREAVRGRRRTVGVGLALLVGAHRPLLRVRCAIETLLLEATRLEQDPLAVAVLPAHVAGVGGLERLTRAVHDRAAVVSLTLEAPPAAGDALPDHAHAARGVARRAVRLELARIALAGQGVARVARAGVLVVAVDGGARARAVEAHVAGRAQQAVVAGDGRVVRERDVQALAGRRVAVVGRAVVRVVAVDRRADAHAVEAHVGLGAAIRVVAERGGRVREVGVDAGAGRRVARVARAVVRVVAVDRRADAGEVDVAAVREPADVVDRAGRAVVAGEPEAFGGLAHVVDAGHGRALVAVVRAVRVRLALEDGLAQADVGEGPHLEALGVLRTRHGLRRRPVPAELVHRDERADPPVGVRCAGRRERVLVPTLDESERDTRPPRIRERVDVRHPHHERRLQDRVLALGPVVGQAVAVVAQDVVAEHAAVVLGLVAARGTPEDLGVLAVLHGLRRALGLVELDRERLARRQGRDRLLHGRRRLLVAVVVLLAAEAGEHGQRQEGARREPGTRLHDGIPPPSTRPRTNPPPQTRRSASRHSGFQSTVD